MIGTIIIFILYLEKLRLGKEEWFLQSHIDGVDLPKFKTYALNFSLLT